MYNFKNDREMKIIEKIEKVNNKIWDVSTTVAITSLGVSVVIWGGKAIKKVLCPGKSEIPEEK